jgi:hypothetical protein
MDDYDLSAICFTRSQDDGEGDAAWAIAGALYSVAASITRLGSSDAATRMGDIEAFSKNIGEKLDALAGAISHLGDQDGK